MIYAKPGRIVYSCHFYIKYDNKPLGNGLGPRNWISWTNDVKASRDHLIHARLSVNNKHNNMPFIFTGRKIYW